MLVDPVFQLNPETLPADVAPGVLSGDIATTRPDRLLGDRSGLTAAVIVYLVRQLGDEVVAVRDHLNHTGENPLIGFDGDPRFPDMSKVYRVRDENSCIVVQGSSPDTTILEEDTVRVEKGVWEAIALNHQKIPIYAWATGSQAGLEALINTELYEYLSAAASAD